MSIRNRWLLLGASWLAYMLFTVAGYPFFSISVLLPSILLCGFTAWLFSFRAGLIIMILTHPYNMLVMMFHLGAMPSWEVILDPGGITAQFCAVAFISMIKSNQKKCVDMAEGLERRIEQRKADLMRIGEYLRDRSRSEHTRMAEVLCNVVAQQQTGLYYHSMALENYLTYNDSTQADAAGKLVQIARQGMEHVHRMKKRLTFQDVTGNGLEQALCELCACFKEHTDIEITLSLDQDTGRIPEEMASNIYRISNEAVSNALRHGKATLVELTLKLKDDTCALEIINNGRPLSATPSEGLGMKLIQQRAERIHATVRLGTTADGRTQFICLIPLPASLLHDSLDMTFDACTTSGF